MKIPKIIALFSLAIMSSALAPHCAFAGETNSVPAEDKTEALAKAAQNPVAKLISVPFQNNFYFNVGPNHVTEYVLNVEPVVPLTLNDDWNLITRTIIPIINLPSPAPGAPNAAGLGDLNPAFYLSPANASKKFLWGVGPMFTLPTATDSRLGNSAWCAGPAAVALTMQGPWVVGVLASQQWSFAGWGDHYVSSFLTQPFVNYNMPHGWYLDVSPVITANWTADSNDQWTVPVGGGIGKIQWFGKLPINFQVQAFYNAVTPEYGPDWQLRFQVQFLFPK